MARGRPKKLPIIRRLEGNRSRTEIEDFGIESQGTPFIPEHLADDARGCIEVIVRSMPPKVYGTVDSFVLSAFGTAWALHKMAIDAITAPGFEAIEATEKGNKLSEWIRLANQQAALLVSLGAQLGLSPRARDQIKMPKGAQQRSKFDGLIGLEGSSISLSA